MAGRIPSVPLSVPPFVLGKLGTNCGAAPRVAWGHLSGKTSVMMLAVRHAAPARERWGQPSEPHNFMRSKPLSASEQEVLRYCATPLCCNEPFSLTLSWLDRTRARLARSRVRLRWVTVALEGYVRRRLASQLTRAAAAWAQGTGRVWRLRSAQGAQRRARSAVRSFF